MSSNDVEKQMKDTIELNIKLKNLLSDLGDLEDYCKGTRQSQSELKAQVDSYDRTAQDINNALLEKKLELDSTIDHIQEFLSKSDGALDRIAEIEQQLQGMAKASDITSLQKKVNDCSRKLTTLSGSIQDYARRTDVDDEIESLQASLEESIQRENELRRAIDALSKKVKRLESEQKNSSELEQKYNELLARIQRLENWSRGKTGISTETEIQETTASFSQVTTPVEIEQVTTSNVIAEESSNEVSTTERISVIIGRGSTMKQDILVETLTSISEVLGKHGIT